MLPFGNRYTSRDTEPGHTEATTAVQAGVAGGLGIWEPTGVLRIGNGNDIIGTLP